VWPVFDTPNILWFFGAFTAAGASDAVVAQVHPNARGAWILLVSLAFLAAFAFGAALLLRAGWWIAGGVLAAMAVTFVAPAGYGLERLIGVWRSAPAVDPFQEYEGFAFGLAVAVAVTALIAFGVVRFHFILLFAVLATFVAAQMLVPVFVTEPGVRAHATAFIIVGSALIVVGLALDAVRARRAAFWWHLVGLVALATGLGYHAFRHATWGWILIFAVGSVLLLLATVLVRGTWAIFGVAGFYAPVAHYFDVWFGNLGTALALAAVGIGLVVLGLVARRLGGTWPSRPWALSPA
jgi:hypothetical protein